MIVLESTVACDIFVVGHTEQEARLMLAELNFADTVMPVDAKKCTRIRCISFASLHRADFSVLRGLSNVILIANMGIALPSYVRARGISVVSYYSLREGTCVSTCTAHNTCLCMRSRLRTIPPVQYEISITNGLTPYDEDIKND